MILETLDGYSLYYFDENSNLDIDDFIEQLYTRILFNIQKTKFTTSLTKRGDNVFFNIKFPGMELKFTTDNYAGQKFDKGGGGFKLWIPLFDNNKTIMQLMKSTENDIRIELYNYFVDNKQTIVHELTHVYQDVHKISKNHGKHQEVSDIGYLNLPEEVDAYTSEIIHLLKKRLDIDPKFNYILKTEIDRGRIWKYLLCKLSNNDPNICKFLRELTSENDQVVTKRILNYLKKSLTNS